MRVSSCIEFTKLQRSCIEQESKMVNDRFEARKAVKMDLKTVPKLYTKFLIYSFYI